MAVITRQLNERDKETYNRVVTHPLQSWQWGEFRQKTGVRVVRVGLFSQNRLLSGFQLTIHRLPVFPYTIGYLPKGSLPDEAMIEALINIGRQENCIFIKLEPNVRSSPSLTTLSSPFRPAARPLFTKYTFYIDLTRSEVDLFSRLTGKTRYNVRLAKRHEVTVQEENTKEAFNRYWELTQETARRQGFYAHDETYHRLMWQTLQPAGTAHLLTARYRGKILVTWVVFLFNGVLYYPYGASSTEHKEVMASNLMMWEAIRWGKTHGAKLFDLWGTPGPDPKPTDPYYGFHRFKMSYGPELVEFIGSYDLILKQPHYHIFTLADKIRWILLNLKSRLQ